MYCFNYLSIFIFLKKIQHPITVWYDGSATGPNCPVIWPHHLLVEYSTVCDRNNYSPFFVSCQQPLYHTTAGSTTAVARTVQPVRLAGG
jgi:hypothetical protein